MANLCYTVSVVELLPGDRSVRLPDDPMKWSGLQVSRKSVADLGKVLRARYGRCISRMYRDRADGSAQHIGWVFRRREGGSRFETWVRIWAVGDVNLSRPLVKVPGGSKRAAFVVEEIDGALMGQDAAQVGLQNLRWLANLVEDVRAGSLLDWGQNAKG